MTKPLILVILDGWGVAEPGPGNAVELAITPTLDQLFASYPHCELIASGEAVGLPKDHPGNSEVGHLNLGAGKIVYQDLARINMAIADGTFLTNHAFVKAINNVKQKKTKFNILGLIGSGGVHSYREHIYALLWFCKKNGLSKDQVKLHLFTDGRDSPPTSSPVFISELEKKIEEIGIGQIATISGRYYAMDRDNRWERTQLAYEAMVDAKGAKANSALEAIDDSYKQNRTDEFIIPTVICDRKGEPLGKISDSDSVVFVNFRPDRARQLTKTFVVKEFTQIDVPAGVFDHQFHGHEELSGFELAQSKKVKTFPRNTYLPNLFFVTMVEYERKLSVSAIAFTPSDVPLPLARIFSEGGLRQFHIAETEKYPHVTYFFNGRREEPYEGEDRLLVPSPKVATYDLKPEMSASVITKDLIEKINLKVYDFFIVNFANLDMVGHTGILPAATRAVEVVDSQLGQIVRSALSMGLQLIITGDHGNCEQMISNIGDVDTEHSKNPVPCILIDKTLLGKNNKLPSGILADVAPTILKMMGLTKPNDMTGRSII